MVDINLFKDDEEEKDWKPNPEDEDQLGGALDEEDLGFGDDASEPSSLDEEGLLDEEVIPEFEEPDEEDAEGDYEFGEVRERKTPVWLWAFLGVVVIGVFVYLFVIQPRMRIRRTQLASEQSQGVAQSPDTSPGAQDMTVVPEDTGAVDSPSTAAGRFDRTVVDVSTSLTTPVATFVDASKMVYEDLSTLGQFGTVIIMGDRFFVEYVSETANVSKAMGDKIRTLLGASDYIASPEERYLRGGSIRYSGVISGELPQASRRPVSVQGSRFDSIDSFIEVMKDLTQKNRLTTSDISKFTGTAEDGDRAFVRMKIEGTKAQTLPFLDALKVLQGNYGMSKLTLTTANYSDFRADQVKLVLELWVSSV